jgi:hypothetical protein
MAGTKQRPKIPCTNKYLRPHVQNKDLDLISVAIKYPRSQVQNEDIRQQVQKKDLDLDLSLVLIMTQYPTEVQNKDLDLRSQLQANTQDPGRYKIKT